MQNRGRRWIFIVLIVIGGLLAYFGWQKFAVPQLPDGIASGNGRIEATEIDISTKLPGRLKSVSVKEGDFVKAGQVLAVMDSEQLQAQLRQSQAELKRARIGVETAQSLVRQREAEKRAAQAVIDQRNAQLDAAARRLTRSEALAKTNSISLQVLDDDTAAERSARAAVAAAEASLAANDAAISTAQATVVDAQAQVDAAQAAIDNVATQIADCTLTAPRDGRIQYLVAQPGEVLASGGRVISLVDLGDVYMTFFLPAAQAGKVSIGTEARIILDAAPQWVIPAKASFVADVAQFTPKTVETEEERQKLMFRIRAQIPPALLRKYISYVKTGLPGMAYIKLDTTVPWPESLEKGLVK